MRARRPWGPVRTAALLAAMCLAAMFPTASAGAAELTRAQALAALLHPVAQQRLAGVHRLAGIGRGADAERLLNALRDTEPALREAAAGALWQIWSRSGDAAIDQLYARGIEQMQARDYPEAVATFSDIVRRKPDFAEGWNKRATLYFLLGDNEKSLLDCDQVLKRNRLHFGALSGAGQIHLQLGNAREALDFFRRAVDVNPALEGPARMIPLLEQLLRDKGQKST